MTINHQLSTIDRRSAYDAELCRGYPWFTYPKFYNFLASRCREVVEVGSWKGFSTVHLAKALQQRPDGGWLHAVDVWDRAGAYWRDFCSRFPEDSASHLYGCFLRHLEIAGVAGVVLPHRMRSLLAADEFARLGRTFDAVFIDGDHRYQAVRDDIAVWRPLVRPGGILSGHDYNNRSVKQAVDDVIGPCQHGDGHTWWIEV